MLTARAYRSKYKASEDGKRPGVWGSIGRVLAQVTRADADRGGDGMAGRNLSDHGVGLAEPHRLRVGQRT